MSAASEPGSAAGRDAERPSRLGWQAWKQILLRTKDAVGQDNVALIAAGVSFYAMLALFPAIAAFVGLYGLVADPSSVAAHLNVLRGFLPAEAFGIVESQVRDLTAAGPTKLGFTSVLALLLALWSARLGVNALVLGLNICYKETDQRGFFAQVLVSLCLTAILLGVAALALAAILAVPAALSLFSFDSVAETLASIVRWPILVLAVAAALAILYRYGPHRERARFAWLSWGAALATVLWAVGSAAFSVYVANFASYNETYGSLGAVVGLLMWFYLSAFIVLVGAEVNAQMELHTRRDTTTGPPEPMGRRGAFVADNLPSS